MLNSLGLLVLRVSLGGMLLLGHGWGKLAGFTQLVGRFPDPLGIGSGFTLALAVFAEVFCAAAIIVGFATRLAAVPIVTLMLVAVFVVHANDPWANKELALLYAVPAITLILTGAGSISLDAILGSRRHRRRL